MRENNIFSPNSKQCRKFAKDTRLSWKFAHLFSRDRSKESAESECSHTYTHTHRQNHTANDGEISFLIYRSVVTRRKAKTAYSDVIVCTHTVWEWEVAFCLHPPQKRVKRSATAWRGRESADLPSSILASNNLSYASPHPCAPSASITHGDMSKCNQFSQLRQREAQSAILHACVLQWNEI